ncbi:MAG: DNA topoisomerase IV subunit A [Acidobacteria bacterium]|nr:MAG: DNA topoisomerase IV subunit A [Acidobacteriota bacterium]
MSFVEPLMRRNFLEYASYVIVDRAIPDLRDGLKPVQRRLLHTLHTMDDGRFHKVANVIGETMKLHPHGDASIGDALVVLANKDYFIEKQGNFGNVLTGHPAAAARYIECRLTDLARETLFNPRLTEWQPSYDGRRREPVALPAKLPVVLLLGTEGIAVGMSTRILPHNLGELLRAQVDYLEQRPFTLYPDFPQGGLLDVADYDDGRGRVRCRARLEAAKDRKTVTIRELPYGQTTESLIASIEAAVQKGKLKVAQIEDRTAEQVEIVLHLRRGVYSDEVIPQLWAHTNCEVSVSSNIVVIDERRPVEMTVSEIVARTTDRLVELLRAELRLEEADLEDRRHYLTLEQIFIENRVYKKIERATTEKGVRDAVRRGMEPFREQMVRELTDDDITRLLDIRIRRISAYDIEKNRRELGEIEQKLKAVRRKLRNMKATTIAFLDDLIDRYGERWPRRTEITGFEEVDVREVAVANLKLVWDPETGFLGTDVRKGEVVLQASEFDKVIVISDDGSYRIGAPPQKLLVPGRPVHIGLFDQKEGLRLTIVYRDRERFAWAKKVHIRSFIHDKEYELIRGREGKVDHFALGDDGSELHLAFVPKKRQRVRDCRVSLAEIPFVGLAARGKRLAPKPVARVRVLRP